MKASRNVFYSLVAMKPNPKTENRCGCCSKYLEGMFAYEPVIVKGTWEGTNYVEPAGKDICEACAKNDMQKRLETSMDRRATEVK